MSQNNIDYTKYSIPDLFDIYKRIDRTFNKDGFNELKKEIHRRTGLSEEEIDKEVNLTNYTDVEIEKKNKSLKIISWVLIIYSGFTFLSSLVNAIATYFVGPSMYEHILKGTISPISEFLFKNMFVLQVPSIIISLLFIVFTIGVFKREESARKNIINLLWFAIIWNIAWTIFTYEFITTYIVSSTLSEMPMGEFIKSGSFIATITSNVFIAVIIGIIIYKLNTYEVKKEFNLEA